MNYERGITRCRFAKSSVLVFCFHPSSSRLRTRFLPKLTIKCAMLYGLGSAKLRVMSFSTTSTCKRSRIKKVSTRFSCAGNMIHLFDDGWLCVVRRCSLGAFFPLVLRWAPRTRLNGRKLPSIPPISIKMTRKQQADWETHPSETFHC